MLIVYVFLVTRCTTRQASHITGYSVSSVVDGYNICREACSKIISSRLKFCGTHDAPIQVGESYFSGRRKYNRGRFLSFDQHTRKACYLTGIQKSQAQPTSSRNCGNRIAGLWVVGLLQSKENVHFLVVPDHTAATLTPVIEKYVVEGSIVVTDEWRGYSQLERRGFFSQNSESFEEFVSPETGYHTKGIERQSVDAKSYMKSARHPGPLLQIYLDECAWRKLNLRTIPNPFYLPL